MERIEDAVDYQASGWDAFFEGCGSAWRDRDYRYLNRMFDLGRLQGSLLDVGCALGDGFALLRRRCRRVVRFAGSDFSGRSIEVARANPALKDVELFRHDVLEPLPARYDNVLCLQTLEHVTDPTRALQHLIDATRRVLIVASPYLNRRPDENHLWKFDESDFADLMDSYQLDRQQKNIYWLLEKTEQDPKLRRARLPRLLEKLLYDR